MTACATVCTRTRLLCLREEPEAHDLEALRSLLRPLFMFTPAEQDMAVELVEERLARGPASGYEFLLLDGREGELAGYACYGRAPCTADSWDLYWIAVDAKRQKHGLGRLLLQEVEARVLRHGGGRLYAETSSLPRYAPTRGFYRAAGFAERARFPDYYAPGDDKVVFEKPV